MGVNLLTVGPQSWSHVIKFPGPPSPKIMSPENFSPVSDMALDGPDGLLGCLIGCGVNHGMEMGR